MATRVVHAHPVPESYSAAVLDAVLDGLHRTGGEPVLHRVGTDAAAGPSVAELESTRTLVFVHPTWWGGQPAVLLDWVQRTLAPWIDGGATGPSPLRNVTRLTAVTTHGSSAFVNRLQGEPGRKLLRHVLLPLCATGAEFDWVAKYSMDRADDAERRNFLDHVRDTLAGIAAAAA